MRTRRLDFEWRRTESGNTPVAVRRFMPTTGGVVDPLVTHHAVAALQVVGADRETVQDQSDLFRAHMNVAQLLETSWSAGRSCLFIDIHVPDAKPRGISLHIGLGLLGGDDVLAEVDDLTAVALAAFAKPPASYRVEIVDPMPLLTQASGYAARIRQRTLTVGDPTACSTEIVSRWDSVRTDWHALCNLLLSRQAETRLRICTHGTTLGLQHRFDLEHAESTIRDLLFDNAGQPGCRALERGLATVVDLRSSLESTLFVGEIIVGSSEPLNMTVMRAIASEISAELDVIHAPELHGMTVPVVAARGRIVGGSSIEWVAPTQSAALTDALPTAGVRGPVELPDLWTMTEAALAFRLPTPRIPTIAEGGQIAMHAPAGTPTSGVRIGIDPLGTPVFLDEVARGNHVHLLGTSGVGKSTVMLRMIEADLADGAFFFLLDPHGDTAAAAEEASHRAGREVAIVDITRHDSTPIALIQGLHLQGEERQRAIDRSVAVILAGITSHLPPEFSGPRFGRLAAAALRAVVEAIPGGELGDVSRFLSNGDLRAAAFTALPDELRHVIETEMRSTDWAGTSSWVASKFDDVTRPAQVDRILARFGEGLDIGAAMHHCLPVVVTLGKGDLGSYEAQRIGQLLLTLVSEAAFARAPDERRPARIYVDEIHSFPARNLQRLLDEARKFKVSLVAAHQTLEQLPRDLAHSLLGNPQTRLVFRVNRADAVWFADELGVPARALATQPNYTAVVRTTSGGVQISPFTIQLDRPTLEAETRLWDTPPAPAQGGSSARSTYADAGPPRLRRRRSVGKRR